MDPMTEGVRIRRKEKRAEERAPQAVNPTKKRGPVRWEKHLEAVAVPKSRKDGVSRRRSHEL